MIVGIVVVVAFVAFLFFKMKKKDENTTSGTVATGGKPSDSGTMPISKK